MVRADKPYKFNPNPEKWEVTGERLGFKTFREKRTPEDVIRERTEKIFRNTGPGPRKTGIDEAARIILELMNLRPEYLGTPYVYKGMVKKSHPGKFLDSEISTGLLKAWRTHRAK